MVGFRRSTRDKSSKLRFLLVICQFICIFLAKQAMNMVLLYVDLFVIRNYPRNVILFIVRVQKGDKKRLRLAKVNAFFLQGTLLACPVQSKFEAVQFRVASVGICIHEQRRNKPIKETYLAVSKAQTTPG